MLYSDRTKMPETNFEDSVAEDAKKKSAQREQEKLDAGGGATVTPSGAAALGKNKDQAKMFGTKQQKSAALASAAGNAAKAKDVSQDDLLATAEGEQTFEDKAQDAASIKAEEYSEKFKAFGSLGKRVENAVKGQFSNDNAISLSGMEFDIDEDSIDSELDPDISDEDRDTVYATVNGFDEILSGQTGDPARDAELQAMSPADREKAAFESIVELSEGGFFKNKEIGVLDTLKAAFKNNPEGLKDATASAIANSVVDIEDLDIGFLMEQGMLDPKKDLGFSTEEMASTFGADWQSLSTDKIAAVMDNEFTQKHARADKLMKALKDPNTSPAIKEQLQLELKEMGVSGALQFEQLSKDTIQQVEDSGIVMFGGKPQAVKDLLNDETIKADTKSFLNDPTSDAAKKFREDNPQYAAFMDEAFKDVEKSGETLGEAFDEFIDVNKDNTKLLDTPIGGAIIGDELWAAMGYDDDLAAERIDPTSNHLYNAMMADKTIPAEAVGTLKTLVERGLLSPDYLNKIDKKQADGLIRLLATGPNRIAIEDLVSLDNEWSLMEKAAGKTPASHENNKEFYSRFFKGAGISNEDDIQIKLRKLRAGAAMGVAGAKKEYDRLKPIFDKHGDGKIDDPATVRAAMSKYIKDNSSLEDVINSNLVGGVLSMRKPANTSGIENLLDWSNNGSANPDQIMSALNVEKNVNPNAALGGLDDLRKSGLVSNKVYKEMTTKMIDTWTADLESGVGTTFANVKGDRFFKSYKKSERHLKENRFNLLRYTQYAKEHPTRQDFKERVKHFQGKVDRNTKWGENARKDLAAGPLGIEFKKQVDKMAEYRKAGPVGEKMWKALRTKMQGIVGKDSWWIFDSELNR